jgi:sec-independent protein translocase protein TatA
MSRSAAVGYSAATGVFPHSRLEAIMDLGVPEVLLIVVIALLLFGPGKISGLVRGAGEGLKNFKSSMKDGEKRDEEKKS